MAAFMKAGDIKGESTDAKHKDWILIESMSAPIYRNIPEGARDNERVRGRTTAGDCVFVRQLDKSSVKLQEACANGTFFKEVIVHLCSQIKDKSEPYLEYKLADAIITSYSFHGTAEGGKPTEELTMNYTKVDWTYYELDPKTGDSKGQVAANFDLGKHGK
jgi:type VI secretion system secreted protein Hcp